MSKKPTTKQKGDLPPPKPNKTLPNGSTLPRPVNGGRDEGMPLWLDLYSDAEPSLYGSDWARSYPSSPDVNWYIKDAMDNTD